jgi:hypothetical protein
LRYLAEVIQDIQVFLFPDLYLKGFLTSYDIALVAIDPCEWNGVNPLLQLTDTQRIRLYGADCNQSALVVRFLTSTLLAGVFIKTNRCSLKQSSRPK